MTRERQFIAVVFCSTGPDEYRHLGAFATLDAARTAAAAAVRGTDDQAVLRENTYFRGSGGVGDTSHDVEVVADWDN